MNLSTYLGLVRQHIAGGDMDAALQRLRSLLDNSPKLDEALHHSGRWQDIRRQIRLGTVSHAEATLTQNQIQAALLDLLRDIESQTGETVPDGKAMRKEVERAIEISHSKNVVGGSSISAGGDVKIGDHNEVHHHYGDVRIPEKLTTAGAVVPKDFIGRGRELGEIRERLGAGNGALALVNAEGGMGKTTLAAAYWEGFASKYKHLAWLFCEKGILPAMREQLAGPLGLREDMNAVADDPEKQIELIRTRMANLPKDCLLVLDNANEPDHIRDFERHCTGLGWHVLITSRCSRVLRDEGNEYPITSLPPVEARALFKKNYTEEGADFENLLGSFLEAVGYNTLCIEIFSKNLREGAAWGLDFENLLQHLEQNGLRLGADSFEIRTPYTQHIHSDAATSDEVVEAMYDLGRLSPDENDLFARVCLLPAEQHPPAVLTALLDPNDKAGLKRRLDELAKKGWLGADPAGYRVSPVVQKIVLDKHAARRWELGEVIVQRLQVIFENEGFHSKNIGTAGPFADLAFDLIDNLAIANEDLANLLHRLWVYRNATGDLANALGTAQKMAFLCLEVDDKYNLGRAYDLIGYTYRNLGNLDKSLEYVENY
ncbi:MAG: hypothetical protein KDC70_17475, partial [Saprospiraceae bacterium]|nr:hypothetical protein [Saprospiraceae bacterium]